MINGLSRKVIKKYGLPENWEWTKATQENCEDGMLISGCCRTVKDNEDKKHLLIKTYFIPDEGSPS